MSHTETQDSAPDNVPVQTRPFAPFEWLIALRYLRARRAQSFISVIAGFSFLGILLGVATLVVVMSVMNGFRKELLDKIVGINGHVFLQGVETPLTDFDAVTERVRRVKGVTLAIPMVEGQALATLPFNSSGVLVRGIREADVKALPGISNTIKQGTLNGFDEGGGVAIGQKLADYLSLRIGDSVTVIAPKGAQTAFGTAPRIKAYPVTAIFQIGMSEFDSTLLYMPLSEAQAFFNKDNEATLIEAYVSDPDHMDATRAQLDAVMGRPMIATDWRQRNKTFFDALAVERSVMFLILTLIVLVAALNIISGMTMLVKDKSHDIAILRTMGATRNAILRIFFITGSAIGITGTVAGLLLGLVVAHNLEPIRQGLNWILGANLFPAELYFLSKLPSDVSASDVTSVAVLSLTLSLLATLYPAWSAAKLDPVEALRYE